MVAALVTIALLATLLLVRRRRKVYRYQEQLTQAILNLVMGVLDLSRLEVKRLNYHYQTNCLDTQLRRVVAAINQEARANYTLVLQGEEQQNALLMPLLISLDWGSMEKVLHALLRPTYGLTAPLDTVVCLHRKEGTGVALVVTNSVLYQLPQEEQIIASRINELIISQMGGGYSQELVGQEWVVTLTFNKVEARHFNPGISAAAASST